MSVKSFLENFIDNISTLPNDLSKNFSLMRELDEQSQEKQKDVNERLESYVSEWSSGHTKRDEETEKNLRELQQHVLGLADEKVEIAAQTYDIVDRHIRRLDQDLRDFELVLAREKEKMVGGTPMTTIPGPILRPSLSDVDLDESLSSIATTIPTTVAAAISNASVPAVPLPMSSNSNVPTEGNGTPRKGAGKGLAASHKRTASVAFGTSPSSTTSTFTTTAPVPSFAASIATPPLAISSPGLFSAAATANATPITAPSPKARRPVLPTTHQISTPPAPIPSSLAARSGFAVNPILTLTPTSTMTTPATAATTPVLDARVASIVETADMPVDPNEPVYCYCKRVSFGQMVACDNPDCSREWFHFQCVGLTQAPKGKWYCPDCVAILRKKKATT